MKKYWKKGLALLLAAAMSLSCMVTSFAVGETTSVDDTAPIIFAVEVPADYEEDIGVMPCSDAIYYYQNASLYNSGNSYKDLTYVLSAQYGYAKIWIKNTSSSAVNVHTYYGASTSAIGDGFTIAAGSQQIIYIVANGSYGNYKTTVRTTTGSILYGQTSVLVGSKDGVGYPY